MHPVRHHIAYVTRDQGTASTWRIWTNLARMVEAKPEGQLPPACTQVVGYRGHPRKCGKPARFGLVDKDGSGTPIPMCETHALLCMDHTGARIAVTWDQASN
jgi:hypothetical protein